MRLVPPQRLTVYSRASPFYFKIRTSGFLTFEKGTTSDAIVRQGVSSTAVGSVSFERDVQTKSAWPERGAVDTIGVTRPRTVSTGIIRRRPSQSCDLFHSVVFDSSPTAP